MPSRDSVSDCADEGYSPKYLYRGVLLLSIVALSLAACLNRPAPRRRAYLQASNTRIRRGLPPGPAPAARDGQSERDTGALRPAYCPSSVLARLLLNPRRIK